MSAGPAVTEADYRANVVEMFRAIDMDRNDVLDWAECKDLVRAVMKVDGGYDVDSFRSKYDAMDKNDDGKISKNELVEAVVQIGRERNLFGAPVAKQHASVGGRATVAFAVLDDPNEAAVETQIFREGLSCLGKTFNNARHAYLKLNISDKTLTTLKVSHQSIVLLTFWPFFYRVSDVTSTCSILMFLTIL